MWRRPLEWNLNGTTDPRDGSVDHLSLNSLKDRHGPIRAPKSHESEKIIKKTMKAWGIIPQRPATKEVLGAKNFSPAHAGRRLLEKFSRWLVSAPASATLAAGRRRQTKYCVPFVFPIKLLDSASKRRRSGPRAASS